MGLKFRLKEREYIKLTLVFTNHDYKTPEGLVPEIQ